MKTLTIENDFERFDDVLKQASKSKTFHKEYNEELMRLQLASEIKNLRIQYKLTQESVAKSANMPQSVIARVESGKHSVSLGTLNRIAEVFGKRVLLA